MKKISVVVPVYNAERTLRLCIEALKNQHYPRDQYELIFVDNRSTDRSKEIILTHPDLVYLYEPTKGPAAARNCGARAARHELVAFTDSDCMPDPEWLSLLAREFENDPHLDICGGEIHPYSRDKFIERYMWDRGFLMQKRMILRTDPFPFCISANLCIRRESFFRVGGFSMDYPLASGEDLELGYKIHRLGGRFAYAPDAIVRHHHRTSTKDLYRQFVRYAMGSAQFYYLNSHNFSRKKVELETNGEWDRRKDLRAWARILKHYLLRTRTEKGDFLWQQILCDHCSHKGWIIGKRQWRLEHAALMQNPKPYEDPKLVMFLTPCCWREYYVPFVPLGRQLEERGYQVRFLFGHAGDCTFLGTLENWTSKNCQRQFEYLGREVVKDVAACDVLNAMVSAEILEQAEAFVQQARSVPITQIQYQRFNVWEIIKGSVCREMRERFVPAPGQTCADAPLIEKYVRGFVIGYHVFNEYLDRERPDALMIFNGFFYQERLLNELAQARGIRVIAHENSCFRDRKIFDTHGYVGNWTSLRGRNGFLLRSRRLVDEERQRLQEYVDRVYSGQVNTIAQAAPETEAEVRSKLNIGPEDRVALLIGQVPYDSVMIYDLKIFSNMLEFILKTVDIFREIPGIKLVVRLHPFEAKVDNDRTWKQLQDYTMPENVRIVHGTEINTYSIMKLAQFGICSTSQAGLEMASMRKPVVLVGEAFYGGHGFTHDVESHAEYRRVVRELCADATPTPEALQQMETFLYHVIFEHQIPYTREDWQFSGAAADKIVNMIGLHQHAFPRGHRAEAAGAEAVVNLIGNPSATADLTGWMGLGSKLMRLEDGSTEKTCIRCETGKGPWQGLAYACEKPNTCDNQSVACRSLRRYVASVEVKSANGAPGGTVQLHVIGNNEGNFGTSKAELNGEWQKVTKSFLTGGDTHHLGVQVVKVNNPAEVAFLVRNLTIQQEP